MSRSNRLLYAALRGCLIGLILAGLVWPSLAQDTKRGEQHPGRNQAETKQTPAQPPAAPAVSADRPQRQSEPKDYRDPCSAPKSANESDLCQQWRMAEAAEETANWTYGQVIATAVEAILLAIAIGFAWRAGYWAKRAAITGAETVEVTRTVGMAQSRAYIHPSGPKLTMHENGTITVFIRLKNFGQTPAYDVVTRTSMTATPLPLQGEFPSEKKPATASQGTAGPGQEFTASLDWPIPLSPEYQDDIAAGRAAIFLHGEVAYRDAFKEPRVTRYRLIYTGPWGGEKSFKVAAKGNEAT